MRLRLGGRAGKGETAAEQRVRSGGLAARPCGAALDGGTLGGSRQVPGGEPSPVRIIGPAFRGRVRALRRPEGRLLAVCRPHLARLDDYDAIALP